MNLLLIANLITLLACAIISLKFWNYKKHLKQEITIKDQQISEILAQNEQMSLDLQSKKVEINDLKQTKSNSKFTNNILNKNKNIQILVGLIVLYFDYYI